MLICSRDEQIYGESIAKGSMTHDRCGNGKFSRWRGSRGKEKKSVKSLFLIGSPLVRINPAKVELNCGHQMASSHKWAQDEGKAKWLVERLNPAKHYRQNRNAKSIAVSRARGSIILIVTCPLRSYTPGCKLYLKGGGVPRGIPMATDLQALIMQMLLAGEITQIDLDAPLGEQHYHWLMVTWRRVEHTDSVSPSSYPACWLHKDIS
jgi:hypothetical protein